MRQHILSVISATCAILILSGLTAAKQVVAQQYTPTPVSCPSVDTSTNSGVDVQTIQWLASDRLTIGGTTASFTSCLPADATRDGGAYNYGAPFGPTGHFSMYLPGSTSTDPDAFKASKDPVRIHYNARPVPGISNVASYSCTGATFNIATVNQGMQFYSGGSNPAFDYTVLEIELPDGASCQLSVRWEIAGNYTEFVGATLSREGEFYKLDDNGRLTVFGLTVTDRHSTRRYSAWDRHRFLDGGTDPRVDLNPHDPADAIPLGQPFTLEYRVGVEGPDIPTAGSVGVEFLRNVENVTTTLTPANFAPGNGYVFAYFSVTFTPIDPDFGLHLVLANNADFINNEFRIIIGNPATDSSVPNDDDDVVDRTKRIIRNFMVRRAAQIVGNEPDLTKRLAGSSQSNGAGPVSVSGGGTISNYNLAFATSMRQALGSSGWAKRERIRRDTSSMMALGAGRDGSLKDEPEPGGEFANRPLTGIGFWTEGTLSKVKDGTSESDFDMLFVGADYRINPGLVVGLLAQYDRTDEEDAINDFSIKGKGWLAGPYVVARLGTNLILDARAAWGKSNNEVSPYNTYADEFEGRRLLARGRLTGDFKFGALHVAPHIGVVYYEEEQKTYIDSLGNTIGSQKVELGRLTFGPKLSTTFTRPDGATITPHVAVHGIWDFRRTDLVNIDTGLALTGTDEFRARAQAGITARRADGMAITAEGFYDGIGANGFNSYGTSLRFDVPF